MDLKICRICLRTESKVYKFDRFQLKSYYEEVLALKVNDQDELPQYFCYECAAILHKFHKFKEKCYSGQKALREILWTGPITYEAVYKIDRKNLNLHSSIDILTINKNVIAYTIREDMDEDTKPCQRLEVDKIESIELEIDFSDHDNDIQDDEPVEAEADLTEEPNVVVLDVKKEMSNVETKFVKERKKRRQDQENMNKAMRLLDSSNWKKVTLNEEEAIKEFRARADDRKYTAAAYKCVDCFKGFSKEDMLKRHVKLRHSESLGSFECRFCRMRFKWDCLLRKHMLQHYTKYECLRCHLVCPLENTALLHEESHSGVTKKCAHCQEEFRHASTYYTHLRTHRSEYVCTACGASFVSQAGLHQHKRVKHVTYHEESPDDDEEVNTFCARCDIRFETRKAYEEHLFHSAMHVEGTQQVKNELTPLRKVLGKKLKAKITKEMKQRRVEDLHFIPADLARRRREMRRKNRKPTDCHQCGKHFDTQAACMKHHLKEHPRTSFFHPNERHICEICGSSLAPGSVAAHQNMHSREIVHTCSTCGKQFHSTAGLKRHLVTHTGEKPFGCSLCDKRFTQSNSMKLHYRTFHLKQPYPKRNRRKKKTDPQETVESASDEESDGSMAQPEMEAPEPIEPTHLQTDSDMHYLTLA